MESFSCAQSLRLALRGKPCCGEEAKGEGDAKEKRGRLGNGDRGCGGRGVDERWRVDGGDRRDGGRGGGISGDGTGDGGGRRGIGIGYPEGTRSRMVPDSGSRAKQDNTP